MDMNVDIDLYANNISVSSRYQIVEPTTHVAQKFHVRGAPGSAPSFISIDSNNVVLSIPSKPRFLSQQENDALWSSLNSSVKVIAKGRLRT